MKKTCKLVPKYEFETFKRTRILRINNKDGVEKEYKIKWYINICYLYYDNITIPFRYVKQSNTWLHESKMNLQFYGEDGNICAVLKIE